MQGVETVQGFSGTRCHPDAANFVYMLASGAFSSNRRGLMPTIYISDSGDDKNDGLSLRTAIYSLDGRRNSVAA